MPQSIFDYVSPACRNGWHYLCETDRANDGCACDDPNCPHVRENNEKKG